MPISIKLSTTYHWIKEILDFPNEGLYPLQWEVITKMQMEWSNLKIFSRTTEPEELKFT
jgi:hypothetical protein